MPISFTEIDNRVSFCKFFCVKKIFKIFQNAITFITPLTIKKNQECILSVWFNAFLFSKKTKTN